MRILLGIGEVEGMFERLVTRADTREEVARLASMLLAREDNGVLEFLVPEQGSRIRRALLFLCGADLLVDDHNYLHTQDDIVAAQQDLLEG